MKEQLIDFDRYIISEDGNIYSKWFNKNLERKPSNDGYVRVTLNGVINHCSLRLLKTNNKTCTESTRLIVLTS